MPKTYWNVPQCQQGDKAAPLCRWLPGVSTHASGSEGARSVDPSLGRGWWPCLCGQRMSPRRAASMCAVGWFYFLGKQRSGRKCLVSGSDGQVFRATEMFSEEMLREFSPSVWVGRVGGRGLRRPAWEVGTRGNAGNVQASPVLGGARIAGTPGQRRPCSS